MSQSKTMLSMIVEECYHLIAIHCSFEAHQVAFVLNKCLRLKLKRRKEDIDFLYKELVAFYPLFHYFDQTDHSDYYLVSNKFKGASEFLQSSSEALFPEKMPLTTHLITEYKNADYFLKIEDESEIINIENIINDLNKIPQISTAYLVDVATLRSQQNLIFN